MRFKYLLFVALMALSSCDSREDWFERNAGYSDLIVEINGVVDTIRKGDVRRIEVDLRTVNIDKDMPLFNSDTVYVTVKGIGDGKSFPLSGINVDDINGYSGVIKNDGGSMTMHVLDYYFYSDYVLFSSDTAACLLKTYNGRIVVFDEFYTSDNALTYSFVVNLYGNIPPRPVLTYSSLGDNEYNLSLEQSYDKDGKVEKYEWCIDGNIVSYGVKEPRYERIDGDWQSGKAADGGTYIKATDISNVNHSFQTTGEHTVYYRCMDNLGAWSMWYSEKINVE